MVIINTGCRLSTYIHSNWSSNEFIDRSTLKRVIPPTPPPYLPLFHSHSPEKSLIPILIFLWFSPVRLCVLEPPDPPSALLQHKQILLTLHLALLDLLIIIVSYKSKPPSPLASFDERRGGIFKGFISHWNLLDRGLICFSSSVLSLVLQQFMYFFRISPLSKKRSEERTLKGEAVSWRIPARLSFCPLLLSGWIRSGKWTNLCKHQQNGRDLSVDPEWR